MGDGLFGYTWDGVTYADPDTAGTVLAALAPYQDSDPQAQTMADTILDALAGGMDENGSYGSANSDAMVIIGLIAQGQDPSQWAAPSGATVVDGLLSYLNADQTGFTYAGADNLLATEQGFRALVALSKFSGEALNIYDFSAVSTAPGYATGSTPQPPAPSRPSRPVSPSKLHVTLTLETDTETWIDAQVLALSEGSTVYHALSRALRESGLTAQGLEKGYVRSVTRNGVTLAEFDRGPNSGWLYQVNGVSPDLSLSDYVLEDGDHILWYYTADWSQGSSGADDDPVKQDTPSTGMSVSDKTAAPSSKTDDPSEETSATDAPAAPGKTFPDMSGHWAADAVAFVTAQGFFQGVSGDRFDPDGVMSRAMLATVLFRLAGSPASEGSVPFPDVPEDAWYTAAAAWASASGVVQGDSQGRFDPDAPITREQLVTMLYRYAGSTGADISATAELGTFPDSAQVSAYARQAMAWAVSTRLIQGKSGGALDPAGTATRAEVAAVLERLVKLLDA